MLSSMYSLRTCLRQHKIVQYRLLSHSHSQSGPLAVYNQLVLKGCTVEDEHQLKTLKHLEHLHNEILLYDKYLENKRKNTVNQVEYNNTSSNSNNSSYLSSWFSSSSSKNTSNKNTSNNSNS